MNMAASSRADPGYALKPDIEADHREDKRTATDPTVAKGPSAFRFDHDRIASGIRLIFEGLGLDPADPKVKDTPARYARMCDEIFAGLLVDERGVLNTCFDEQHDDIVIVRDIPFASICEHHLVPFIGQAHVAYLPDADGYVTGLSKIVRLVDVLAKRPSLQERMTRQIADTLVQTLGARGAFVMVEAEHMCIAIRGIRKPGSLTVTSVARGLMRTDAVTRNEALTLLRGLNNRAG